MCVIGFGWVLAHVSMCLDYLCAWLLGWWCGCQGAWVFFAIAHLGPNPDNPKRKQYKLKGDGEASDTTGTKRLTLQGSKNIDNEGHRQLANAMDGISLQDCAKGGNMETLGLDFGNVAAASADEIRGQELSPTRSTRTRRGSGKPKAKAKAGPKLSTRAKKTDKSVKYAETVPYEAENGSVSKAKAMLTLVSEKLADLAEVAVLARAAGEDKKSLKTFDALECELSDFQGMYRELMKKSTKGKFECAFAKLKVTLGRVDAALDEYENRPKTKREPTDQ